MKNVEEKNQESPKEAENLANFSATVGECTHMVFLIVFFSERQEFSINNIVWKIFDENLIKIIFVKIDRFIFPKTPPKREIIDEK
jgi:hypothetical protein